MLWKCDFPILSLKGHHGDQGAPGSVGPAGPRVGRLKRRQFISEIEAKASSEPQAAAPLVGFTSSHALGVCLP